MGWPDFQTHKQSGRMRLWNRLIAMNDSRLTKQIFLHDYNVSLRNTWSFDVPNICEQNNIRNIYTEKLFCNLVEFKQNLDTKYAAFWKEASLKKPKLRFYLNFKEEPNIEYYIKLNLSRKERSYLEQQRLGILPINVEIGRYRQIPLDERKCMLCHNENIEDEHHMLFICPAYDGIRKTWLKDIDYSIVQKTNSIGMRNVYKSIFINARQTAKYIIHSMELRKANLFI